MPGSSSEWSFILGEMRAMLAAAQGIAEAIGKRDWRAAAAAAETSGLKAFQALPKQTMMELRRSFGHLAGSSTRLSMAVADAARRNPDATIVTAKLAEAMAFCVACHQAYRLAAKP